MAWLCEGWLVLIHVIILAFKILRLCNERGHKKWFRHQAQIPHGCPSMEVFQMFQTLVLGDSQEILEDVAGKKEIWDEGQHSALSMLKG